MRVDDVKIAGSDLRILGKRVVVTFGKDGNLENVAGPKGEKVRIDVDLPAGPIDEALISRIKKALFVSSEDELKAAVPSYWDGFFDTEQGKAPPHAQPGKDEATVLEHLSDGTPVYAVGGRVTPPKVIHAPDPRFPSTPYKMRIQGTPVLTIIVDEQGNVRMPRIARAIGLGFDDEAARVVQTWSFQPAMLDGRPVASLVNVEVSFRLF